MLDDKIYWHFSKFAFLWNFAKITDIGISNAYFHHTLPFRLPANDATFLHEVDCVHYVTHGWLNTDYPHQIRIMTDRRPTHADHYPDNKGHRANMGPT